MHIKFKLFNITFVSNLKDFSNFLADVIGIPVMAVVHTRTNMASACMAVFRLCYLNAFAD